MARLGLNAERPKWWTVNRKLLPTKVLYFYQLAGVGTLLPFITIYMRQLGLTYAETGIIYGVMPFVGFFVRPIFGAVADKLHQHKLILMITCLLTGVFFMCLLLVPANVQLTTTKIFTSIHCNNLNSYIRDCNGDATCPMSFTRYSNLSLASADNRSNSLDLTCTASCHFAIPGAYSTRVCFTSSVGAFQENCLDIWVSSDKDTPVLFDMLDAGSVIQKEIIEDRHRLKNPNCEEYRDYDLKNVSFQGKPFWRMVCNSETILNCDLQCTGLDQQYEQCEDDRVSYSRTFWIFFCVFLLANIAFAPILSLADAIAYDTLGDQKGRWGKQRLWGTIGFASFAVTSTLIMDAMSKSNKSINYDISFYLFGVHMLISVIVSGCLRVSDNLVCSQRFSDVGKLFKQPKIVVFLVTILIFGLYTGVIEAFLFWHLRELQLQYSGNVNGNAIILGLCLLLNCVAEAPFLFLAGYIIKRLGQVFCMYLAFGGYAVRFLGYSFLTNPWYVLFLEPFHGLTFGLLWAAATSYASLISPPGLSATTQGLVGGLHFGFGKGLGSLLAGFLLGVLGPQWSFRAFGISALVFLAVSVTLHHTCLRSAPQVEGNGLKVPHTDDKQHELDGEDEAAAGDYLLGDQSDGDTDTCMRDQSGDQPIKVHETDHSSISAVKS